MLNVYLKREDIITDTEIIDSNDILFNFDLYNSLKVDDRIIRVMKSIDNAEYLQDTDMRSRFGNITSMENLSTGCKTVINILNHPDLIINCVECGDNVLHEIFCYIKRGNILLEILPSVVEIPTEVQVIAKTETKGTFYSLSTLFAFAEHYMKSR